VNKEKNDKKSSFEQYHSRERQERAIAAANAGDLSELASIFDEVNISLDELLETLVQEYL